MGGLDQHGVGRDPVALREDQHVAAHHLASGDAPARAIADDQRARAGEVAERGERPLGLALLDERDRDDHYRRRTGG